MKTRPYAAALAAAALLAVGGCTGEDDPVETPTTASSTSVTPSSTLPPPTTSTSVGPGADYPAAARENSDAGGAAFVEYYYATLNAVLQAPTRSGLENLGTPDCEFCQKNLALVRDLAKGSNRYASEAVSLSGLSPIVGAPSGQRYYSGISKDLPTDVVDSSGGVVFSGTSASLRVSIAVQWTEGRWLMRGADQS